MKAIADQVRGFSDVVLVDLAYKAGLIRLDNPVAADGPPIGGKVSSNPRAPKKTAGASAKKTGAARSGTGAHANAVLDFLRNNDGAGIGAIISGTGLNRGQVSGALKGLVKIHGSVTPKGNTKRNMTYHVVEQ